MMKLNKDSGKFEFGNWIFTSRYQLKDIEEKLPLEGLELWSSNFKWQSFRLTMVPGYILVVMFKNGLINNITIFPTIMDENDFESKLQEILRIIGGEKIYPWGAVEINTDLKANFKSILIKYNE